jgi:hypothetical protein
LRTIRNSGAVSERPITKVKSCFFDLRSVLFVTREYGFEVFHMVGPIPDSAVVKVILVEFGIIMFTAGRVMSQLEK